MGHPSAASSDFALARYVSDGTLDPIFDVDGTVTTDFGGINDVANGLAIQANGRIVAVGRAGSIAVGSDFGLARYRRDGSLDPTFDGEGKVTTDFSQFDDAEDVAIQADGRIVVVGTASPDGHGGGLSLARYQADGSLDASFGSGGRVVTDLGTRASAYAVELQGDGRIVVAGVLWSDGGDNADVALVRYDEEGILDPSFDGDGKLTLDLGEGRNDAALDLAIQADRKIVVAGLIDPPSPDAADFLLARFNPDGSLDTRGLDPYLDARFGTNGWVATDFGVGFDEAFAVAIESGGRIVVAGRTHEGNPPDEFAVARYSLDGSLDGTFGAGGQVTTDFAGQSDSGYAAAIQPDGAIVVAGLTGGGGSIRIAVARYLGVACCVVGGSTGP